LFADKFGGGTENVVILNTFLVSILFVEWKFYKSDRWGKMSVSERYTVLYSIKIVLF